MPVLAGRDYRRPAPDDTSWWLAVAAGDSAQVLLRRGLPRISCRRLKIRARRPGGRGWERRRTSAGILQVCQLGLEAGDPLVEEPIVISRSGQPFLQSPVFLGDLAELHPEVMVLGENRWTPSAGKSYSRSRMRPSSSPI